MRSPSVSLNVGKPGVVQAGVVQAGVRQAGVASSVVVRRGLRKTLFPHVVRLFRSPSGDVVSVKVGFSWQAFLIGSMSALFKRAWLLLVVLTAFYLVTSAYSGAPVQSSRNSAIGLALLGFYVAYMLFCGINGNRWLVDSLRRRGYILIGEERS